MGVWTATISNTAYPVKNDPSSSQLGAAETLEVRGILTITIIDVNGTYTFTRGQPIAASDSITGAFYNGFIGSDQPSKYGPASAAVEHVLTCFDRQYYFDKGANTKNYLGWYAGDVAVDFVLNGQPGQEGATVAAGLHRDETTAQWNQGQLSGVVGASNVGDGDLELSPSGANITYTEASTPISAPSTNVLKIVAVQSASGLTSSVSYVKIWSGSATITSSSELTYDVFIDPSSPQKTISIDLTFSDGTTMRNNFNATDTFDFYDIAPQPTTDLTGFADVGWYSRGFTLPSFSGKTLQYATLAVAGTQPGTYTGYVRNIVLTNPSVTIFNGTLNVNPPQQLQNNGYSSTELSIVPSYDLYSPTAPNWGSKFIFTTSSISVGAVNILRSSFISWAAIEPAKTHLVVKYSLDGNIYIPCVNNAPLPDLPSGTILTGKSILLEYQFYAETGGNVELTPILESLTLNLSTSYAATKADVTYEAALQADWLAGTLTNMLANSNDELQLNGGIAKTAFANGGTLPIFTTISSGSFPPSFGSVRGVGQAFNLPDPGEIHVRLDQDNMPQFASFTAECDVNINAAGLQFCMLYRTTNWSNADETWGYMAGVSTAAIQLGYGSNSSSGSFTNISTVTIALSTNTDTWHRLKVVVSGSSHKVYLDDVLYITATNSTYSSAGYLGLRAFNTGDPSTTPLPNMQFNNVGIVSALSGTWVSPGTSLASAVHYGDSIITWRDRSANYNGLTNTSILVEASYDNGSTYHVCTNNAPLPSLTVGQSLTSATLKVRVTLTTSTAESLPAIDNLMVRVLGQYSSSGTRSTAPMGIDNAVRANQSGFGTAQDGQTWAKTGTGTDAISSDEMTITNTTGDVHERLGSRTGTDLDGTVRLALSASTISAGTELRYTDSNNFYRIAVSTTAISLVKKVAGTTTTLNTATVALSTGTFYYARFRVAGTTLQARVWAAGTLEPTTWQASATDSSLASGGFGLWANGTGTASFDHFRVTQYPDPSLSLAAVLPRLGSSNVAWNSVVPTNTTLAVKTSLDGVNWSTATSGSAIPGLTSQPDPVIDVFTSNTSANYTSTFKSGGSATTPTFDTANSRLILSGGSGALYLDSSISTSDIDLYIDMDESDAGGLTWRNQGDGLNYYELGCYDDSSSGGFTNQLRLYKVLAGTRSLLGSASTISWARNTVGFSPYKTIHVTMLGAVISVYFDGTLMQTYIDGSPLGAGKCGLRNDAGTSRYYQLRIQVQGDYVSGIPAGDIVTSDYVYTQAALTTSDPSVTPQLLDLTTSARSPQIATGALIAELHDPTKPFALTYDAEMTTIAQASGDFYWHVAQDGSTTFAERSATKAPFCLYSTDLLNKPVTGGGGSGTSGVTPTRSADTYRNQQIVTNTTGITSTLIEQKVADGTATSWNMAYPLYSAPTISVAGVSKTVGIKGVDSGKDFYWQANNNSIVQDSSAAKIPSGYILSFSYVGQFADQVVRNNLAGQAARRVVEGGTGIVVNIVDGKGMLSSNAITYADGLLARNSNNDTVELMATTTRPGLAVGMVVPVFLPEHQLNNRQLLIMKLTTSGYQLADGTTRYEYSFDATDGPNIQNWTAALFG